MWRLLFYVFLLSYARNVSPLCVTKSDKNINCTTREPGNDTMNNYTCSMEMFPVDSAQCNTMSFGPLTTNTHIGGVTLEPYVITRVHNKTLNSYPVKHTALNITFSNIKWKTMRFRFQDKIRDQRNHCRTITLSNDAIIDDQSVLYYDCYWTNPGESTQGQSHILDFEAYGDGVLNRGQYYFNVPAAEMLSPAGKPEDWKPFIYIEIFPDKMRLHMPAPPPQLKITSYRIAVMKECGKDFGCEVKSKSMNLNGTNEVIYDYHFVGENGLFYFLVTPMHKACEEKIEGRCKSVGSPKIKISSEGQTLSICIASVTALIVATLFAYYVALRAIRRYCCKDHYKLASMEIPPPTKVLVIYSPVNRLHGECVQSFVTYLRTEYGLDILYDGDISTTSHGDPYIWAEEAFRLASHVVYICGPAQENNSNIYDKPIITAHKDVDVLLLSFIKANRASKTPKDILNVCFEHSTGPLPVETRMDKVYFLLKDWQKLIAHLSKNLLPKKQIMRTEKGRCFLDDLTRAKKMLSIQQEEIVRNEKNVAEKKILL